MTQYYFKIGIMKAVISIKSCCSSEAGTVEEATLLLIVRRFFVAPDIVKTGCSFSVAYNEVIFLVDQENRICSLI